MKPAGSVVLTNRAKRWAFAALLTLFLAAFSTTLSVHAAEGAEENPADSPIGVLFRWLNFAVVFGGSAYLIAKKAPAFFRRRAEVIASGLTEAAAVKAEAERQLREADQKIQHLDQELAELRAAARREAAAEAERLRAATQAEAAKIARAAEAEIEAAGRAARTELKALAARLAIERAGGMIGQQMTPASQASLIRSFLDRLARQASPGGQAGGVN
jgi:F-type H+-transporting ATPase subunit b